MLLPFIEHHDLIPHPLLQKEQLGWVCGRIMGHGLHLIRKLEQDPNCMDNALVRLAHRVNAQIVATGDIEDHLLTFQSADNLCRDLRRLMAQQANDLRLGQWPVLGQPMYDILLIL